MSIPPPPPGQLMTCEFAKLVIEYVERTPVGVPRSRGPSVSHESSMSGSSYLPAMAATSSQSGQLPISFGNSKAPVLGVIISSMRAASTQNVSSSQSTNAGTSPARTMGARSVEKVTALVTTSVPGSRRSRSTAR